MSFVALNKIRRSCSLNPPEWPYDRSALESELLSMARRLG